ncbi:DUF6114 domain-containing protein [Actinoplanes sp. NPDC051513]|uniref:DUF6114 domain-containing protein n=1 Tax=Actinoplanes sp. NPDC051513 TaxID=3363908 RepID=UPI0037873903
MSDRSAFWRWRHARPFWGGLLVFLGGLEIFLTVKAPLPVVMHVGMQGFIGYLLPVVLGLLGILLIFNPAQRLFYSLLAAVLALASWITSNLGGFIVGLLLALVGSALAFAWSPDKYGRATAVPDAPQAPGEQPTVPPEETGDQTTEAPPGVQPETSQSRPRHRRTSSGLLSGE